MPPDSKKTVVLDATIIIHLAKVGLLNLLGSLEQYAFVVPDQVVEEVSYPDQAEALARALVAGHVRRASSTDPGEMAVYAELKQRMGSGEAACLAMAAGRGWMVGSDDLGKAFQRLVKERIGCERLIDTSSITKAAREQGKLSNDDELKIANLTKGQTTSG